MLFFSPAPGTSHAPQSEVVTPFKVCFRERVKLQTFLKTHVCVLCTAAVTVCGPSVLSGVVSVCEQKVEPNANLGFANCSK